jgi:site-specific recombinase XerD
MKAYPQDFEAIALSLCGDREAIVDLMPADLTKGAMRLAFASYAEGRAAASIRRCWSTWNAICTFLYTAELLAANPMPLIGRPKVPKSLPKGLSLETVTGLVAAVDHGDDGRSVAEWAERDRAIIFIALLAGLRSEELINANVGDIRATNDGAVIQVRGKGNKDRRIPLEHRLIEVVTTYLEPRAVRFPGSTKPRSEDHGLAAWPATSSLFVGGDGQRITRGTLQYRVLRAFKKAGVDGQRARGVLIHGLRHTFATGLANENVSFYTLMKLLGHESMVTSQRYVDGAGTEHRVAAAQNPLYGLLQ